MGVCMKDNVWKSIIKIFVRISIVLLCGYVLFIQDYSNLGILVLTMLLTFYDLLLEKVCKITFSDKLNVFLLIFIFLAQCLGTVLHFYKIFSWWDIMLHTLSGIIFYLVGREIFFNISIRNKSVDSNFAVFILFSFCFALAVGVVWEVFEFSVDGLLGKDTQLAREFVGRCALMDTMTDLISASIGAFFVAVIEYYKRRIK